MMCVHTCAADDQIDVQVGGKRLGIAVSFRGWQQIILGDSELRSLDAGVVESENFKTSSASGREKVWNMSVTGPARGGRREANYGNADDSHVRDADSYV